MAVKGQQIYNKITSDKITFIQTRDDTGGELLQFENVHAVDGIGPVPHRHPLQEEVFIVKNGILDISIAGSRSSIRAGEKITVPPNTIHSWKNGGKEELVLITEFRPAFHFEEIIETIASLSQKGKVDKKGNPDPIQMSATLNAFYGEFYLANMPMPLQKFLFIFFGWVLRNCLGYRKYLQYKNM